MLFECQSLNQKWAVGTKNGSDHEVRMRAFYFSHGFFPDKIVSLHCGRNACYISSGKAGLWAMYFQWQWAGSYPTAHITGGALYLYTLYFPVCSKSDHSINLPLWCFLVCVYLFLQKDTHTPKPDQTCRHAVTYKVELAITDIHCTTLAILAGHQSGFPCGTAKAL